MSKLIAIQDLPILQKLMAIVSHQSQPLSSDLAQIYAGARKQFDALEGTTIYMTGGTGFLGRWLTEALLWARREAGCDLRIVLLSRDPSRFFKAAPSLERHEGLKLIEGDVCQPLREKMNAEFVIHAATESAGFNDPCRAEETLRTCREGTQRALDVAFNGGARRFLLVSSGAVYGPQPAHLEKMPESFLGNALTPSSPQFAYAQGKREAERKCLDFSREAELESVIARCFTFAGAFLPLDGKFALGSFINGALREGRIDILGDGTPIRSYLYAADWVVWALKLLTDGRSGSAYNVGSDEPVNMKRLADLVAENVAEQTGKKVEVVVHQRANASVPPARYLPDIEKARQLGLEITTDIKSSLSKTLTWALGERAAE